MQKQLQFFAVILLASFWSTSSWGQNEADNVGGQVAKIAVLSHADFVPDRVALPEDNVDLPGRSVIGLPDALAARIIEHLTISKRFIAVERPALRRAVLEQRFGQRLKETYLDRTLDKAINVMDKVQGGGVGGQKTGISIMQMGVEFSLPLEPRPVGGGLAGGAGDVGTIGALSDYNDILKDFLDLGSTVGADYLVIGNLEKLDRTVEQTSVPYSTENRTFETQLVDARLRLRVVDVDSATVTAVTNLRSRVESMVFEGVESGADKFTFLDRLGRLAAVKVLDATFPARVVNIDPLVVSRGINDGVSEQDRYRIVREGKEIRDSNGVTIGRLHSEVGTVEVSALQDTFSVVKATQGADFAKGDLALFVAPPETEAMPRDLEVATGQAQQEPRSATAPLASESRPSVAVGLIKSGSTARTGEDSDEHTPIFTDTIVSRLVQTKRFKMIDRQEIDQLLTEQQAQALAAGRDISSPMGSLEGADLLLYGSLASFGVKDKQIKLPNSSTTFTVKTGHAEGNMRIVDARSGAILESRKISVSQPLETAEKGSRIVAMLADSYARQAVLMLLNAAYPIKVASVGPDQTVYINRGNDGGLVEGETLVAYRPGEQVVDPDTGVQLGVEETVAARIVVQEVEDARSKGVVAGSTSDVARGYLLKRTRLDNTGHEAGGGQTTPEQSRDLLTGRQYDEGAADTKAVLAMGDVKINASARTDDFSAEHARRLGEELLTSLANTNRFVILERQQVDQVLDEKAFEAIAAGDNIENRLQEFAGADYLIHGEISNFYIDVKKTNVAYLDEQETSAVGIGEGVLRIVDVHNGAVVAADKVRISHELAQAEPIDRAQVMSDLIDRFVTRSVDQILGRLFPIKVLGSTPKGVLYINRGADAGLKKGDRFEVLRPTQELRDPDTGRSFGYAESKVGRIEVVRVEASRARAQVIAGDAAKAGDIARELQEVNAERESSVEEIAW